MSKLGLHISAGKHNGLADALRQCHEAGNPIPVIFSVDQNVWPDIARYSPKTVFIFRTQHNWMYESIGDGPGSMYQGGVEGAIAAARSWMADIMPVWAMNPAHYYAPINEQEPSQPAPQALDVLMSDAGLLD